MTSKDIFSLSLKSNKRQDLEGTVTAQMQNHAVETNSVDRSLAGEMSSKYTHTLKLEAQLQCSKNKGAPPGISSLQLR